MNINPIILRYKMSLLRPRQMVVHVFAYVVILFVIACINGILSQNDVFSDSQQLYKALYAQFLAFFALLSLVWAPHKSSEFVWDEEKDHSYDFFRLLPMSAASKAIGILVGRNVVTMTMSLVTFVLALVFGFLAHVSALVQFQLTFMMVAVSIFFCLLGLLSTLRPPRRKRRTGALALIVVCCLFLPWLFQLCILVVKNSLETDVCVPFYGFSVPVLLLVAYLALYFALWTWFGVCRLLNDETQPLFTYGGSLGFTLGLLLLLIGFIAEQAAAHPHTALTMYLSASTTILCSMAFSFKRPVDYVVERVHDKKNVAILRHSLPAKGLTLLVLWIAVTFLGCTPLNMMPTKPLFDNMLTVGGFYFVLCLMIDVHTVYRKSNERITLLMNVCGFLYLAGPVLVSYVLPRTSSVVYSMPLFVTTISSFHSYYSHSDYLGVWTYNSVIATFFVVMLVRKYREFAR